MMRRASLLSRAALAAAGIGAAGIAEPSGAQDRIVVTAQKRLEPLIDAPMALSAFDAAALEVLDLDGLDRLAAFTPGLAVQLQSPNTPSIAIRGVSTDNTASTVEARAAVFEDGVPASRTGGAAFALYDLERIEVARGPQSTLYGRAALVGGVNIIQNKPSFAPSAYGSVELGERGRRRLEGALNLPLRADRLALRLAGVHAETDGFVPNRLGRPLAARRTQAARAALAFTPSSALRLDLIVNAQEDRASGTPFKSGVIATPGGDASPFTPAALNTFGGFADGRDIGLERRLRSATGLLTWRLDETWTLSSVSGFRSFDGDELFDPDGSALPFIVGRAEIENEQLTQELRLAFDGSGRIEGFVGASYFREHGSRRSSFGTDEATAQQLNLPAILAAGGLGAVAQAEETIARGLLVAVLVQGGATPASAAGAVAGLPLSVVNAQLAALPVAPPLGPVDLDDPAAPYPYSIAALARGRIVPLSFHEEAITDAAETTSWDLFGDVTVSLAPAFDVSLGLRYSADAKSARVFNTFFGQSSVSPAPTLLLPVTYSVDGGPGAPVETRGDFDGLAWRLVGSWRLGERERLWASYARGRRPPVLDVATRTIDPDASLPSVTGDEFAALAVPTSVGEETVDSLEIGGAAELAGGAFVLQASAWHMTYRDFQLPFLSRGRVATVNGGDASGPGLEASLTWRPSDGVMLLASYAYNGVAFEGGSAETSALGLALDGARFRLSPEHEASLGGRLGLPLGRLGEAYLIPTWSYRTETLFENGDRAFERPDGSLLPLSQEAYGVLDLRVGLASQGGRWSAEAFLENALDEDYLVDAGNIGLSFGVPTFVRGAPRLAGVRLAARF